MTVNNIDNLLVQRVPNIVDQPAGKMKLSISLVLSLQHSHMRRSFLLFITWCTVIHGHSLFHSACLWAPLVLAVVTMLTMLVFILIMAAGQNLVLNTIFSPKILLLTFFLKGAVCEIIPVPKLFNITRFTINIHCSAWICILNYTAYLQMWIWFRVGESGPL